MLRVRHPFERCRCVVAVLDELEHLVDQVSARVELAATEHFAGEDREERFDLVQPRRVHWRVVDHEAGMLTQPLLFTFERCELPLSITTCIDNDESIDSSIWPRNSMK